MDQGLAASSNLSPRSAGTMAAPYAKDVARVVQPGAVAKRITQLQSALFHTDPSPSSKTPSPQRVVPPATKARSGREYSRSSLSPSRVPLPQTPFPASSTTNSNWRRGTLSKTSTIQQKDDIAYGIAPINQPESTTDICDSKIEPNSTESNKLYRRQKDQNPSVVPEAAVVSAQSASKDPPLHPLRPKPSILSPRFIAQFGTKDSQPQDFLSHIDSSPEPNKRSASPSPGGAYSKISPFTSNTAIPSYIPTRQSPKDSTGTGPSLRKFKSMFFSGQERLSSASASPQSPRTRNARSLRRKMFNVNPDVSTKAEREFENARRSSTSTTIASLEDVFTDPVQTTNTYHVEPTSFADDSRSISWANPFGKQRTNDDVGRMPRSISHRHIGMERPDQPAPVGNTELNTGTDRLYGNHVSHNHIIPNTTKPASRHSSCSSNQGNNNATSSHDSRYQSPNSCLVSSGEDIFPKVQNSISPEGSQRLVDHNKLYEEPSLRRDATIPALDGTYCPSESRYYLRQRPGPSNVSSPGEQISNTRVLQDMLSTGSNIGFSHDPSHDIQSSASLANQENGLRLIITVDRSLEKAVRIEVHPLVNAHPSTRKHDEENSVIR